MFHLNADEMLHKTNKVAHAMIDQTAVLGEDFFVSVLFSELDLFFVKSLEPLLLRLLVLEKEFR